MFRYQNNSISKLYYRRTCIIVDITSNVRLYSYTMKSNLEATVRKNPNFCEITRNIEESDILYEIFRVVSRIFLYISCYIAENWLITFGTALDEIEGGRTRSKKNLMTLTLYSNFVRNSKLNSQNEWTFLIIKKSLIAPLINSISANIEYIFLMVVCPLIC